MTFKELQKLLASNPDLVVMDMDGDLSKPSSQALGDAQKRRELEHEMQVKIIEECAKKTLDNADWGLIFAIPNGGHRNPTVGAKLKAEGVKAGIMDLFLPLARHSRNGLFIECKVRPNGPSKAQEGWIQRLRREGYAVEVIYDDWEVAIRLIEWYIEK